MLSRFIALILLCAPFAAPAQYPSQTVRVVVGFPPGGTTDVIGRLVAQGLAARLGRPFVVENRAGASGSIGAAGVAKAVPDGHTLLLVPSTQGTNPFLYASLPYDTERDFAPVSLIASTPYVFLAQYAPAGTPADVVWRLNAEVNALIMQPVTEQRFRELGATPFGGPSEALAAFLKSEQDK